MLMCSKCNKELAIKDKVLINNGEDIEIIYKCDNEGCDYIKVISSEEYI